MGVWEGAGLLGLIYINRAGALGEYTVLCKSGVKWGSRSARAQDFMKKTLRLCEAAAAGDTRDYTLPREKSPSSDKRVILGQTRSLWHRSEAWADQCSTYPPFQALWLVLFSFSLSLYHLVDGDSDVYLPRFREALPLHPDCLWPRNQHFCAAPQPDVCNALFLVIFKITC